MTTQTSPIRPEPNPLTELREALADWLKREDDARLSMTAEEELASLQSGNQKLALLNSELRKIRVIAETMAGKEKTGNA